MDVKWDYQLKNDQRSNPVVYAEYLDIDKEHIVMPSEEQLKRIFINDGFRLQTWKRSKDKNGKTILTEDPHWIAVRGGTPLHVDPRYPRYSHHLKVRCDDGIYCRGLSREELHLRRGLFYILDTHSPHQVFHKKNQKSWNVAASVDSHDILDKNYVLPMLLEFAKKNDYSED